MHRVGFVGGERLVGRVGDRSLLDGARANQRLGGEPLGELEVPGEERERVGAARGQLVIIDGEAPRAADAPHADAVAQRHQAAQERLLVAPELASASLPDSLPVSVPAVSSVVGTPVRAKAVPWIGLWCPSDRTTVSRWRFAAMRGSTASTSARESSR